MATSYHSSRSMSRLVDISSETPWARAALRKSMNCSRSVSFRQMPRAFLVWPRTSLTKCRPHGLSAGSDTHANNMLVCCPFSSRRCCKFLEQKQCRQIQTRNSFVLVRTRVQHTNKCTWGKKEICMSAMMDSVMRLKLGYSQVYSYLHCSKQLS